MLNLTNSHVEAISQHLEAMPNEFITVGSVVKIKNSANSKNLKYVVVAAKADTVKIVWKSVVTDKNSKVYAGAVISANRFNLVHLSEKIAVPQLWLDLLAN